MLLKWRSKHHPNMNLFFSPRVKILVKTPKARFPTSYNLSWPSGLPRRDSHHAVVRPCGQLWDVASKGSKVEPILCGVHVDMEFWEGSWIKHCALFHARSFFPPKSWKKSSYKPSCCNWNLQNPYRVPVFNSNTSPKVTSAICQSKKKKKLVTFHEILLVSIRILRMAYHDPNITG